jgi:cobalt/nickel transport system permease protein
MHIPDGFLSLPVWATLDVAAIPAVAWAARRAQTDLESRPDGAASAARNHLSASPDERRIPLLGVMGAFVFAAQMINFPVGLGTSGHLVGGALLAIALGPATAATVMTAVLILQAFILQDGGVMALGANVLNMAIAGVLAGYLPYRLWGRGRTRSAAIFLAGFVSVALSASLALTELLISGVPISPRLLSISGLLFLASGVIEGAITVAAIRAIERMNPGWVRAAAPVRARFLVIAAFAAAALVCAGLAVASAAPDAIQAALSIRDDSHPGWLNKAFLGLAGMAVLYAALLLLARRFNRHRVMRQGLARQGSA